MSTHGAWIPVAGVVVAFAAFAADVHSAERFTPERFPAALTIEYRGASARGTVVEITVEIDRNRLGEMRERWKGGTPPLELSGALARPGMESRTFSYRLPQAGEAGIAFHFFQAFAPGSATLSLSLAALAEQGTVSLASTELILKIPEMAEPFQPAAGEGLADAEAVVLEDTPAPAETGQSMVRLLAPRRDIAPQLVRFKAEVDPAVKRVEFHVDGKLVMARGKPPWEAELDLGAYPRGVEVKAIGYDARGRFLDADVIAYSERYTPLTVKILRLPEGPKDGARFKVAVSPARGVGVASVALWGDEEMIREWKAEPYIVDIPAARLARLRFLRAEARGLRAEMGEDLLFFDGTIVERVEVNAVELPVVAVDARGVPVPDLLRTEVVVREQGVPVELTGFALARQAPLSLGLLIDTSGSMKERFPIVKAAARGFAERVLREADRGLVTTFSFEPQLGVGFTGSRQAVLGAIDGMPEPAGGTSIYDALISTLYAFRGVEGRRAVVVLTDGEDTTSRMTAKAVSEYAAVARVPVYVIGIKVPVVQIAARSTLSSLADDSGGRAYFIGDEKDLERVYRSIEDELRTQYLASYRGAPATKGENFRRIEIESKRPGVKVRTVRGYVP